MPLGNLAPTQRDWIIQGRLHSFTFEGICLAVLWPGQKQ